MALIEFITHRISKNYKTFLLGENYAIHCIKQSIDTLEAVLGISIADMVSKVLILELILSQA